MTTPSLLSVERERLPPALWASVWGLLESVMSIATADAESLSTHEPMLCALVKGVTELYEGGRPFFEEADLLRLLRMAERLARPYAPALVIRRAWCLRRPRRPRCPRCLLWGTLPRSC